MVGDKKVIALCISRMHDPLNINFIKALNERMAKNDLALFIYNLGADLTWYDQDISEAHRFVRPAEISVFDLINPDITDALIIMDEKIRNREAVEDILERNKKYDIPIIIVDGKYDGYTSIDFNYEEGFEKVVRHVIEEHHVTRPFYMAGVKDNYFSEQRLEVFKKVLSENNIPFDKETMVDYGDYWCETAKRKSYALIERGNLPEAIICANDNMCLGVCSAFTDKGYRIPEDIIVTGFDGIDEIYMCDPKITSCAFTYGDLSDTICDVLMKFFRHEKTEDLYLVSSHMVISESCGCKPDTKFDFADHYIKHIHHYSDEEKILSEISAKIQTAPDIDHAMREWKDKTDYEMVCMINKSFFDDSENEREKPFDDVMTVFCDSKKDQTKTYDFPYEKIIPDLEKFVQSGKPLVFIELDYLNISFGYVCCNFDIDGYCPIHQIIFAMNHALGGYKNIRYQVYLKDRLEQMYMCDSLTGLYTRKGASKLLKVFFRNAVDNKSTVTAVLSDLDKLKYINDTFGHNNGDNAISVAAKALIENVPDDAISIRFGGDEMISFFSSECDSWRIKCGIYGFLSEYNKTSGKEYDVSSSIGIYSTNDPDEMNFELLVNKADELMYIDKTAKKQKR